MTTEGRRDVKRGLLVWLVGALLMLAAAIPAQAQEKTLYHEQYETPHGGFMVVDVHLIGDYALVTFGGSVPGTNFRYYEEYHPDTRIRITENGTEICFTPDTSGVDNVSKVFGCGEITPEYVDVMRCNARVEWYFTSYEDGLAGKSRPAEEAWDHIRDALEEEDSFSACKIYRVHAAF